VYSRILSEMIQVKVLFVLSKFKQVKIFGPVNQHVCARWVKARSASAYNLSFREKNYTQLLEIKQVEPELK